MMNGFLICLLMVMVMVQLWHPCASQIQPNLTTVNGKPLNSTEDLYKRVINTRLTNPWSAIYNNSYYVKTILTDGRLNEYTKAVAHFALNNALHIHKAELDMLQQGLKLSQSSTDRLAANDSLLFKELIDIENKMGLNYIQKYADPIIGPIPDRIKQLPLTADTQDYIKKLNDISLTKKVVPILAAHLVSNYFFISDTGYFHTTLDKPNVLADLLIYHLDSLNGLQRISSLIQIHDNITAHEEAGMTPNEQQQAMDTFDDIWSAQCRQLYANAFVEQMGAYSRQPGDSQPFLKQYLH